MTQSWKPPSIQPFERLHVTDGLLMNAERWRLAHEYHRQRQNVHYQSLNQPGIVWGLGVGVIAPPTDARNQYRDGRWVQIQPGIAIDLYGNFIVVSEPHHFRIVSENHNSEPFMVYLTISYVDPETLRRKQQTELLKEAFRIDEKVTPPSAGEVELCRILLPLEVGESSTALQLENPRDVFFPGYYHLDLRHRPQARSRPQSVVRAAQLLPSNAPPLGSGNLSNLAYLLQSVEALYPAMSGVAEVAQVSLSPALPTLTDYDLLYLKSHPFFSLTESELATLKTYLDAGGVLLVEIGIRGSRIEELRASEQQLQAAIARINSITTMPGSVYQESEIAAMAGIKPELEAELTVTVADIYTQTSELCQGWVEFAEQLGTPLVSWETLPGNHPLCTQPFLFGALPSINNQPLQILTGGGIIITLGDLSVAWGLEQQRSLPRETLRTAQELGINLLHFAWRKRQLTQSLQITTPPLPPAPEKAKRQPLKGLYDKLS